jgi:hypothetical protein
MFVDARQRPWTGTDFPAVEAWFVRHATPLDRVVAATDRPRYWLPHAALVNGRPAPLYRSVNILNGVLDVAQVLHGRAMWHRGAGRYAEAWRDIRAILRLGRSITAGESGPSMFFAVAQASALEQMAARATIEHLVGSPAVPGDVIATIRRDLDALGPPAGTTVSNATEAILFATSRHWRSDRVGTALVRILSDGSTAALLATYAESRARFVMTRTAAALAAWRADQPPGTPPYPDRLDTLVPKYLAAPADR